MTFIKDLVPNFRLKQRNIIIDPTTERKKRFVPIPSPLLKVNLTEYVMLLPNICHVEHNTCDEEDGLEKVIASSSVWPFATCNHRKWGYDQKVGLYRYRNDEVRCDCPANNKMHCYCDHALFRIAQGKLDEAVVWYSRAVQITPQNDCEARLQATAFCSLGIFLSSHLQQKLPHKFMKNDSKAVLLFKVGAIALKSPYCMYFYGRALAHGQGGVKENRARSMHYLNLAGAQRVGEAFFELGKIHEEIGTSNGASGSVNFNIISVAAQFYKAAQEAYTFEADTTEAPSAPHVPPTGEAETFDHGDCRDADYDAEGQRLNPPTVDPHPRRVSHVPPPGAWMPWWATIQSLLYTEGLDTLESSHSSALGQTFSWGIASQAFLIGGSLVLADTSQSSEDGFETWRWAIPILGMYISVHSLVAGIIVARRSNKQQSAVYTMLAKKSEAYRAILYASINDSNYKDNSSNDDWKAEKRKFQRYLRSTNYMVQLTLGTVCYTVFVNVLFLIAWYSVLISDLSLTVN
jgi:hypothetical protein